MYNCTLSRYIHVSFRITPKKVKQWNKNFLPHSIPYRKRAKSVSQIYETKKKKVKQVKQISFFTKISILFMVFLPAKKTDHFVKKNKEAGKK